MSVDESIETVEAAVVEPTSVIDEELVRSLALKLNPYIKIGREVPVTNLKPSGWLADVVDDVGWTDAEAKFPEVGRFLLRLRGTLEDIVAAA